MKNIKKVIAGVLSLVIIFTVTGCRNKEEGLSVDEAKGRTDGIKETSK